MPEVKIIVYTPTKAASASRGSDSSGKLQELGWSELAGAVRWSYDSKEGGLSKATFFSTPLDVDGSSFCKARKGDVVLLEVDGVGFFTGEIDAAPSALSRGQGLEDSKEVTMMYDVVSANRLLSDVLPDVKYEGSYTTDGFLYFGRTYQELCILLLGFIENAFISPNNLDMSGLAATKHKPFRQAGRSVYQALKSLAQTSVTLKSKVWIDSSFKLNIRERSTRFDIEQQADRYVRSSVGEIVTKIVFIVKVDAFETGRSYDGGFFFAGGAPSNYEASLPMLVFSHPEHLAYRRSKAVVITGSSDLYLLDESLVGRLIIAGSVTQASNREAPIDGDPITYAAALNAAQGLVLVYSYFASQQNVFGFALDYVFDVAMPDSSSFTVSIVFYNGTEQVYERIYTFPKYSERRGFKQTVLPPVNVNYTQVSIVLGHTQDASVAALEQLKVYNFRPLLIDTSSSSALASMADSLFFLPEHEAGEFLLTADNDTRAGADVVAGLAPDVEALFVNGVEKTDFAVQCSLLENQAQTLFTWGRKDFSGRLADAAQRRADLLRSETEKTKLELLEVSYE